jgi:hypothetical protein
MVETNDAGGITRGTNVLDGDGGKAMPEKNTSLFDTGKRSETPCPVVKTGDSIRKSGDVTKGK